MDSHHVPVEVRGAQSFTVWLEGWGSPRLVAVHQDQVFFQAAVCYPCDICSRRVQELDAGLERSGLSAVVEKRVLEQLMFFVIPLPSQQAALEVKDPEAVVAHLSSVFDHPFGLLSDTAGRPVTLPMERNVLAPVPTNDIVWEESKTSSHLSINNKGKTLEWATPNTGGQPAFAQTNGMLGGGSFRVDFMIDELEGEKLLVGFTICVLVRLSWGEYGGYRNVACMYDPNRGTIIAEQGVNRTGLPTLTKGKITLELFLEQNQPQRAVFTIDGTRSPEIQLPQDSVVIPSAFLFVQRQKVTLLNFTRL